MQLISVQLSSAMFQSCAVVLRELAKFMALAISRARVNAIIIGLVYARNILAGRVASVWLTTFATDNQPIGQKKKGKNRRKKGKTEIK